MFAVEYGDGFTLDADTLHDALEQVYWDYEDYIDECGRFDITPMTDDEFFGDINILEVIERSII